MQRPPNPFHNSNNNLKHKRSGCEVHMVVCSQVVCALQKALLKQYSVKPIRERVGKVPELDIENSSIVN